MVVETGVERECDCDSAPVRQQCLEGLVTTKRFCSHSFNLFGKFTRCEGPPREVCFETRHETWQSVEFLLVE